MADYFDQQPSFTNPSYATPEMLANARAYADALTKRSGETVNRPAGAAANFLTAITAALTRNDANRMQQEAAQGNARNMTQLVGQQQAGHIDPATIGTMIANPMVSPEQRAFALKLMTPEKTEDVYNRPAYTSPGAGVQAAPIQGQFQPGVRTPTSVSPEGISGTTFTTPPQSHGGQPQSNTPAMGAGGMDTAMDTMSRLRLNSGRAGAVTDIAKSDIAAANDAPTIKRVAGTMLDDLHAHGDQMTFGPTAEWSNTIKRGLANYAPGAMKDQLSALASADSFDKMHAQLSSILAKSGGTDAQLFNSMRSVPGAHNSKEGAEALLKMTIQVADQQQALGELLSHARSPQEYVAIKNQFYAHNPIVNPITGNPIKLDLERNGGGGNAAGGGARIISVRPIQ